MFLTPPPLWPTNFLEKKPAEGEKILGPFFKNLTVFSSFQCLHSSSTMKKRTLFCCAEACKKFSDQFFIFVRPNFHFGPIPPWKNLAITYDLDIQSSGRRMGGVTYLYVGDVFIMLLGSKNANLLQKITLDLSRVMLQIFHCSKVFYQNKNLKKNTELIKTEHCHCWEKGSKSCWTKR